MVAIQYKTNIVRKKILEIIKDEERKTNAHPLVLYNR